MCTHNLNNCTPHFYRQMPGLLVINPGVCGGGATPSQGGGDGDSGGGGDDTERVCSQPPGPSPFAPRDEYPIQGNPHFDEVPTSTTSTTERPGMCIDKSWKVIT